ncbi:MAG TPA: PQQ-binding-like beta-propeller repeat protein [Acidimicrobiales bacterium]
MKIVATVLAAGVALATAAGAAVNPEAEKYWPQWRGPHATGVAVNGNPPAEWSESRNVRWKVEIPGRGSSSPVVWGDRLFLLSAVPAGVDVAASHTPRGAIQPRVPHRFVVMALDRRTGKTIWERTAVESVPHEPSHPDNGTWASSSATTDGEHVIAAFDSFGYFAYDMNGTPVWQIDLGDKRMRNEFGEGSTPALHGNYLVVVWDHFVPGASFIITLDKRTGKELWRAKRDEIDTWATPLVVEQDGRAQVIVNGMNRLRSYDLETGSVVWEAPGTTMNPIPSPVAADGMVFATSGFRGNNLKAIRLAGAKGDISTSGAIVWTLDRDTPYVPSPLLYNGILYLLKTNSGILSAFDAKSGKPHYQAQRLDGVGEVFSSPVGAAGRVYVTDRTGVTLVIRNSPTFEVIAKNTLDDGVDASPAIVDNTIYIRGYKSLYAIGN